MSILAWIEEQRRLKLLTAPKYNHPASDGSQGLWVRCDNCDIILYIKHLKENQRVCFQCGFHLQMNSQERIDNLIDSGTWRPFDETLSPCDPLEFRDQKQYTERLREAQERTGLQDAIQTGTGMLDGIPIALGVMDFNFMGGSMGSAVGEKITRLIEYATQEGLTLILVCASGGARMQEGILSLMQMAKISAALQVYQSCANLLYISVLTSPTTGGVTASFAMLGDLIFAEPKALIGFAGRRVIEQTLQEQLPDDFQTSEYLLHHGLLDLIVPRSFLKQALSETITLYKDAPLKRSGRIPHGVQQRLGSISQEKVRRNWLQWNLKLKKTQVVQSSYPFTLAAQLFGLADSNFGSSIDQLKTVNERKFSLKENNLNRRLLEGDSQDFYENSIETGKESLLKQSGIQTEVLPKKRAVFNEIETVQLNKKKSEFSYREILLSFYTMFQFLSDEFFIFPEENKVQQTSFKEANKVSLLPNESVISKPYAHQASGELNKFSGISSSSSTKGEVLESYSFPKNSENEKEKQSLVETEQLQTSSKILNKALSLASNQTIQWRSFYMKAKIEPKKKLLENFKMFQEKPFLFSTINDEKYFFYKPVLLPETAKGKGVK